MSGGIDRDDPATRIKAQQCWGIAKDIKQIQDGIDSTASLTRAIIEHYREKVRALLKIEHDAKYLYGGPDVTDPERGGALDRATLMNKNLHYDEFVELLNRDHDNVFRLNQAEQNLFDRVQALDAQASRLECTDELRELGRQIKNDPQTYTTPSWNDTKGILLKLLTETGAALRLAH